MKYITISVEQDGVTRRVPILFPDFLVHAHVATAIMPILRAMQPNAYIKPDSGGTVFIENVDCTGESTSLGVKSRNEADEKLICMIDYLHGIDA